MGEFSSNHFYYLRSISNSRAVLATTLSTDDNDFHVDLAKLAAISCSHLLASLGGSDDKGEEMAHVDHCTLEEYLAFPFFMG